MYFLAVGDALLANFIFTMDFTLDSVSNVSRIRIFHSFVWWHFSCSSFGPTLETSCPCGFDEKCWCESEKPYITWQVNRACHLMTLLPNSVLFCLNFFLPRSHRTAARCGFLSLVHKCNGKYLGVEMHNVCNDIAVGFTYSLIKPLKHTSVFFICQPSMLCVPCRRQKRASMCGRSQFPLFLLSSRLALTK